MAQQKEQSPPAPGSLEEALERLSMRGSQVGGIRDDDFRDVRVWFVDEGNVLARFATRLATIHREGRLVRRPSDDRGPFTVWVVYGDIALADGVLDLSTLKIGPAFRPTKDPTRKAQAQAKPEPGRVHSFDEFPVGIPSYRLELDPTLGVTAALLRLVSPEQILNEAVKNLRQGEFLVQLAERLRSEPVSDRQIAARARLEKARPRTKARAAESEIATLAMRYLSLVLFGLRRPLPQLAREFGLTREQVRDRLHRATDLEYLERGTPGKATARPGPALLALGWNPPETNRKDESDGIASS